MKKYFPGLFMLLSVAVFGQVPDEIQDPWTIGINKLPPRMSIWPSPNLEAAKVSSYDQSEWVKSLNGDWKFNWSKDPQSRPVDFYRADFDKTDWKTIPVPSTIERQGYGKALYSNYTYPFKVNPPMVMDTPPEEYTTFELRNSVGSYSRSFIIPKNWQDKQIILHFAGISSAAFVWVNGEQVGYTQGSRLPAEFDVSKYLVEGENNLSAEVYQYCDGSYLEDQDFWRLSGIFRDVFIRAIPKVTLWDVYAEPEVDLSTRRGEIKVRYSGANFTDDTQKKYNVAVSVVSPSGETLVQKKNFKLGTVKGGFNPEKQLATLTLDDVELWYHEKPRQYMVLIELLNGKKLVEAYYLPVGFRKIVVDGEKLIFNGLPLKIRGINRHESSPDQGYVVTKEQMIEEIAMMKRANIYFVRTSHYPDDPRWYELCNQYGMLVMDEANIESHGLSYHKRVLPGDHPEWTYGCLERMKRMIIRDRQNPCVVMWSFGNEAGFGDTFPILRDSTRSYDPEKRLIHYADMNLAADFDSQTYPTVEWLKKHLEGRATRKGEQGQKSHEHQHGLYPSGKPFVMNEYSWASQNCNGNLADYWDLIYQEDMLAGGFVWDWIDRSLWRDPQSPNKEFVYGGDYGDYPNDGSFCLSGIVKGDLEPYPHYYELQKVYQPVRFKLVETEPFVIELVNHNYATNVNEYSFSYEIMEDGNVTKSENLPPVSCPAAGNARIVLDNIVYDKTKECHITVKLSTKEDNLWSKKGSTVAWEQFKLSERTILPEIEDFEGSISFIENENEFLIDGERFKAIINKSTGLISGYRVGEQDVIIGDTKFSFWRALTIVDKGWKVDRKLGVWRDEGDNFILENLAVNTLEDGQLQFQSQYTFARTKSKAFVTQTISQDGTIQFDYDLSIPEGNPNVPRIGMQFAINKQFKDVEWYGRGPHENYEDRKTSAAVGIYSSELALWNTDYIVPMENGNRCDVRWLNFGTGNQKISFEAMAQQLLSVSAWPYSQEVLESTTHNYDLQADDKLTINIDCKQMGVGGDNGWGETVMDKYQIKPGKYKYSFKLGVQ